MATEVSVKNGGAIIVKDFEGEIPEGKKFVCWNTKKDGTGVAYRPGQKLVPVSDTRLYPVWSDAE